MVIVTEVATRQRLLRAFLGVGVLGGYTTFSTYVVDIHRAAVAARPGIGLLYLAVTVLGALLAECAATATISWLVRRATGAVR
ncbi:hypothetical protein GCM10009827_053920 [Dactylosporangium maewongense]|uniref:Fluoride-specific ion channel n=1 Tax=Dactylosporangium maewongense TaxID=634393 RepID=A0ABP4LR35_9ACTN